MTQKIANICNLSLVRTAMEKLASRNNSLPGFGVLYGPAGTGKTTALLGAANASRAYYVQVRSAWGRKALLEKILAEMGVRPAGTIPQLLDQVCQQLAASGRPLMIDEFDFCLRSAGMVELVRDIYESSQSPIILAGEELLPTKLKRWERFHSRVLSWIPAQPVSFKDAQELAPIYCPVPVADDWLQMAVNAACGSVRRLCVNLSNAADEAAMEGWREIDLASWGKRPLYTGEAPARRGT
jgi:hypothetical protein